MRLLLASILLATLYNTALGQSSVTNNRCLDSLLKRKVVCKLSGENTHIRSEQIRNAAFGYTYWVPLSFKVIPEPKKYTDTESYISSDKKCLLMLWPGKTINFPLGQVDSTGKFIGVKCADIFRAEKTVDEYIRFIKEEKESKLKGVKILEFCKGIRGYNFQVALKGIGNGYGYIYKIDVSEIPVSGDLIFKHFLYRYSISAKKKYEKMGVAMANSFAEF